MSYHAEHHLTPQLPFWALPALHSAIAPRVHEVAPGYVAFHLRLASALRSAGRSASRAELGRPTGESG